MQPWQNGIDKNLLIGQAWVWKILDNLDGTKNIDRFI